MPVTTIRGQLGSGAPEIRKLVAEKLHYDYVDRKIAAEVAAQPGYPKRKIEAKEMPAGTLSGRISEALNHSYPMDTAGGSRETDKKTAVQKITRFDTSSREFITRYFKVELEDLIHYDPVIDAEHLTFDNASYVITDTLFRRSPVTGN